MQAPGLIPFSAARVAATIHETCLWQSRRSVTDRLLADFLAALNAALLYRTTNDHEVEDLWFAFHYSAVALSGTTPSPSFSSLPAWHWIYAHSCGRGGPSAASRHHIRRAATAACSLIWMAKRCLGPDCGSFWAQRGALPYRTRKPPFGGPLSHIAPSSGNAGRSPYPSVVFGLSMLVLCRKARVWGVPFLFIAVPQRFVFRLWPSCRLRWDHASFPPQDLCVTC